MEGESCLYCRRVIFWMGDRWTHYVPHLGGYVTHPEHPQEAKS